MIEPLDRAKAIRAKCLDCSETCNDVRLCPVTDCALWPWRFGMHHKTIAKMQPKMLDPEYVVQLGKDMAERQLTAV